MIELNSDVFFLVTDRFPADSFLPFSTLYNEYTFLFIFKNILSAVLMCYGYEKCIAFTTQIFPKLTKCKIRKDTMLKHGTKLVQNWYSINSGYENLFY